MNKDELIAALTLIAAQDTICNPGILDHPCTVAIRAINQCFEDIESLRGYIEGAGFEMPTLGDESFQPIPTTPYNPEW